LSNQPADVEKLVRSLFSVKEFFSLPGGELEFRVAYDEKTKAQFELLYPGAVSGGFRPELSGTEEDCVLILRKDDPPAKSTSRIPVILALLTLASVVIFSLLQSSVYSQLIPSLSSYGVVLGFGATIVVLIGAHELGQRLVARKRMAGHSNVYLIPGIPFLPPFLPSLGFASTQRQPALNRDHLFDVVVAGPLVLVGLAIVAYVVGDLTSVHSTVAYQSTSLANSTVSINSNAIQIGIDKMLGPLVPTAPVGFVQVSPVADGATVGFIIAFIGLLPMAIFDGGLLMSLAWGERVARLVTYLSVLALLMLDTPTYWALAIVVLLLTRPYNLKLLDEISGLSTSRQWIFVGTLVLAFLCVPVPHNLGTFPLP
jgi:peptidase M50-like protein